MIENTILRKNRAGFKAIALGLRFPSTQLVEAAALAGFDAIGLDGEHGTFDIESVDLICRVANAHGLSVMARVPNIDPDTINLWLDRGVQGITGPDIESGEQAQRLADACLYPPAGKRSWGSGRGNFFGDRTRIHGVHGSQLAYSAWVNTQMIVCGQIESRAGYDNLDAILAVPGLTAIAGGPNDFAASLGFPGEPEHPERRRLSDDADARARAAGKHSIGDLIESLDALDVVLSAGHDFVQRHRQTPIGPA